MSDGTIKLPSWTTGLMIPVVAAALSGAMVWGASSARAEATAAEIVRLEETVKKTAERAVQNGELSAVNQAQIQAVVSALKTNSDALAKTDASLNLLIQTMLKNQN